MKFVMKVLIFVLITHVVQAQKSMPEWFVKNMEESVGTWVTDNAKYKSDNEPFDQYGMDWEWGIGKKSIKGTLYGIIDGKDQGVFWEFIQYWNYDTGKGLVIQFGADGTVGKGSMRYITDEEHELTQKFVGPSNGFTTSHRSTLKNGTLVTTSFDITETGDWKPRRSYTWKMKNTGKGAQ